MRSFFLSFGLMSLLLVAPIISIGLTASMLFGLVSKSSELSFSERTTLLFAFALLGGVPGVITGESRESVVGAMLTALVGLVAGMLAFLFSKDAVDKWRRLFPFFLIVMLTSALFGIAIGSIYRKQLRDFDRAELDYRSYYDNIYAPVRKARKVREIELENLSELFDDDNADDSSDPLLNGED